MFISVITWCCLVWLLVLLVVGGCFLLLGLFELFLLGGFGVCILGVFRWLFGFFVFVIGRYYIVLFGLVVIV